MKRIIRLTESDLTRIVKRVINEKDDNPLAFATDPNYMDYAGFNKSSKPDESFLDKTDSKVKKSDNSDTTKYIVFVAGTNTTGIAHKTQYDTFKNALGEVSQTIKYFNYNEHKNNGSILFKWLEENKSNVDYLILFSAACYLANRLSPTYVPTSKTFCIEPWASELSKPSWTNIPAANFYVNANAWQRGANAKENIPKENKNILTSHVKALTDAVKKIFI